MTDVNGITGAKLITKPTTKEYTEGHDRIFNKNKDKGECICHDPSATYEEVEKAVVKETHYNWVLGGNG